MSRNKQAVQLHNFTELFEDYSKAKRRLLIFDYDGTLTPIVNDPAAAIPSVELLSRLNELSGSRSNNDIWVISGRERWFFDTHFGEHTPHVNFVAEHGCWVKPARPLPGMDGWINLTEATDPGWKSNAMEWFDFFTYFVSGSTFEDKENSLAWHYRNVFLDDVTQPKIEFAFAAIEYLAGKRPELQMMHGKAVVELRPATANKGHILRSLVEFGAFDFILCAGDDITDEDMFRALEGLVAQRDRPLKLYTCHVGNSNPSTTAKYTLEGVDSLRLILYGLSVLEQTPMKISEWLGEDERFSPESLSFSQETSE